MSNLSRHAIFAGNSIFSKLQMLLQGILEEINHREARKGFWRIALPYYAAIEFRRLQ